MELRLKSIDYLDALKFLGVYFPKKGMRKEIKDALIYLVCFCCGNDDEFTSFFLRRGHGARSFEHGHSLVVGKKNHHFSNDSLVRAVDMLAEEGLALVVKGYRFDETNKKNGETILCSKKIRNLLEKYGKRFDVKRGAGRRFSFGVKWNGEPYSTYAEFQKNHGENYKVFNLFRRGNKIEEIYNGMKIDFPSIWNIPDSKAEAAIKCFCERYPSVPENEVLSAIDYLSGKDRDRLFCGGDFFGSVHGFGDFCRIFGAHTQIRKFLLPILKINEEYSLSCDLKGSVPSMIMGTNGEPIPDDVYVSILEELGESLITRDNVKAALLYSLNSGNRNKAAGSIIGDSESPYDYIQNLQEIHRAVLSGEFERAVGAVSPSLRGAFYRKDQQERAIMKEAELWQNVLIRVHEETGKPGFLRFDEGIFPESLPDETLEGIVREVANNLVFRGLGDVELKIKITRW